MLKTNIRMVLCPYCTRDVYNVNSHCTRGECPAFASTSSSKKRTSSLAELSERPPARPQKQVVFLESDAPPPASPLIDSAPPEIEDFHLGIDADASPPNRRRPMMEPSLLSEAKSTEENEKMYQKHCADVHNSIGCSSESEFNVLKLAIDYNLPQGAANEIIRLMKECSASKKSVEEVKQIPRVIKHMYNKMDDRLRLNIGTDSGIKVQVAPVPLPDAECFRENR